MVGGECGVGAVPGARIRLAWAALVRAYQAEASEIDSSGMGRGRAIVGSWGKYNLV